MTDHTKPVPSTESAPEGSWFKSSYSDQGGGNCVEVAVRKALVGIRDSKEKNGPALTLPRSTYITFIDTVKSGAVDFGVLD
ncbi:DUF397 domain-containing protein [Streptomyces sp. TRM49041]|uniref:DUF397 domain-containing protein n=1 Tax=Streptomyces sp. TRM49041 TaxID=2603216 RepID=UPI0011EF7C63|nr:DUF397 domain-containing protein [Streptomyces sp. TRM49041]